MATAARLGALVAHTRAGGCAGRDGEGFPLSDASSLARLVDGSAAVHDAKELVIRQLERDGAFAAGPETVSGTLLKVRRVLEYFGEDGRSGAARAARLEILAAAEPAVYSQFQGHFGQFMSLLEGLGGEGNLKSWLGKAQTMSIMGCVGMSELNSDEIQTTARFVGEFGNPHFVLDSPTDGATKWAVPGAGSTATHAIILARLMSPPPPSDDTAQAEPKKDDAAAAAIADTDPDVDDPAVDDDGGGVVYRGVHAFMVQLRKMGDGALLPGVHCGPLADFPGPVPAACQQAVSDVGYIQLTAVRIGAGGLLAKHVEWKPIPEPPQGAGGIELGETDQSRLDRSTSRAALHGLRPLRTELTYGGSLLGRAGAWSKPPLRDKTCCFHPLTGVPYLRPGPRRCARRTCGRAAGRRGRRHRGGRGGGGRCFGCGRGAEGQRTRRSHEPSTAAGRGPAQPARSADRCHQATGGGRARGAAAFVLGCSVAGRD